MVTAAGRHLRLHREVGDLVKIGLNLPVIHPAATASVLLDLTQAAESLGFHEVFAGEHVVLSDEPSDLYPGGDGTLPFPPNTSLPDPLTLFGFLAGATQSIRLATGILLLSQRNPLYTAKIAATLDWASNGRLDLGVGLGWNRIESELCGAPWHDRAARLEEHVSILRTLWGPGATSYDGDRYTIPPVYQYPKPVQDTGPPIWIGGMSDGALQRVARIGDGWYGFGLVPSRVARILEKLDGYLDARRRSRTDLSIVLGSLGPPPKDRESVEELAEVGVDQYVVSLSACESGATMLAELEQLAQRLIDPAASQH